MRENQRTGRCADCGATVDAGAGELTGAPGAWVVRHRNGECTGPAPGARSGAQEMPRWSVYGGGLTPDGNQAFGVRLVDSWDQPHADAVPINEPAKVLSVTRGQPEGDR